MGPAAICLLGLISPNHSYTRFIRAIRFAWAIARLARALTLCSYIPCSIKRSQRLMLEVAALI